MPVSADDDVTHLIIHSTVPNNGYTSQMYGQSELRVERLSSRGLLVAQQPWAVTVFSAGCMVLG